MNDDEKPPNRPPMLAIAPTPASSELPATTSPPKPPLAKALPAPKRTIISDAVEVAARLRALGLAPEALTDAVRMGQDARSSCTPNDPPSATGIHGWGRTVRGLREHTLPLGWSRFEENGIQGVITEDGSMVIAVSTGDEATGCVGLTPKTAYPKGLAIQAAVHDNWEQLSLFAQNITAIRKEPAPTRQSLLWLLMTHEDKVDLEVRFELSLPDAVGGDERVERWTERIILAPISADPTPKERADLDEDTDIEIPLTRKE